MKKVYFTVGPSQVYPTIYNHIQQGLDNDLLSLSHTGKEFTEIYEKISSNLKTLFNIPQNFHVFFTGSSTESMERIIANTVRSNSTHLITGGFAQKFHKIASDLRKNPKAITIPLNNETDFTKLEIPPDTELLCITENETSTGMRIPLGAFSKIKKNFPNLLIAIDVVSSIPYAKIDYSVADLVFFSVQKGLGMPAGLGVLIVSEAAIEKTKILDKEGLIIGSHHSFISLATKEKIFKTPTTPNVFYIYLLGKIIEDLLIHGIDNIRKETEEKAKMIYDFFNNHQTYKPVVHRKYYSMTTPVIDVQGEAENIVQQLTKKNLIVSKGYGVNPNQHIRIANFPAITKTDTQRLINALSELR